MPCLDSPLRVVATAILVLAFTGKLRAEEAPVGPTSSEAARHCIEAIVAAAEANEARPAAAPRFSNVPVRLRGDRLTEHYVRRAAAAAAELPETLAAEAFLASLAVGLDDTGLVRGFPLIGARIAELESHAQRQRRTGVLGSPTIHGRRDLCLHFAVSAGLAAWLGPPAAEAAGLAKEVLDAQRGSGFSFADLAANTAGIEFARGVLDGRLALPDIAQSFRIADYVPAVRGLPEGIAWTRFQEEFGSLTGERFRSRHDAIRERVLALPGHRDDSR